MHQHNEHDVELPDQLGRHSLMYVAGCLRLYTKGKALEQRQFCNVLLGGCNFELVRAFSI